MMVSPFLGAPTICLLLIDKTTLCARCKGKNVLIECACGCSGIRVLSDKHGRQFRYIRNHDNRRAFKKGEQNPVWKGGRMINDRGYILLRKADHPFAHSGYVLEHRFVMEQKIGRILQPWEDVHHINGDKKDNRIENLELLTHRQHAINTMTGAKYSVESRLKMSQKHLGVPLSKHHRIQIAIALKRFHIKKRMDA